MMRGSDICAGSSTALTGANDLDTVAGTQRRMRPGRARDDGAVHRHGDSALGDVERLLFQQRRYCCDNERLVLAVDTDARLGGNLGHCILLHSAAARCESNRSMPNGRITGSASPSSTSRAMASAVMGVSRMPLRWW